MNRHGNWWEITERSCFQTFIFFCFRSLVILYIILKIENGIRVHAIVHLETILVLSCPILVLLFTLLYAVIHETLSLVMKSSFWVLHGYLSTDLVSHLPSLFMIVLISKLRLRGKFYLFIYMWNIYICVCLFVLNRMGCISVLPITWYPFCPHCYNAVSGVWMKNNLWAQVWSPSAIAVPYARWLVYHCNAFELNISQKKKKDVKFAVGNVSELAS